MLARLAFFLLALLALALPARAEEATGIVKVKASVGTAEVFIDGVSVGGAPVTRILTAGQHKVRVVADFNAPWVRVITVEADKSVEVVATLTASQGSVEFSGPKGGKIVFDGTEYPLPARVDGPKAGVHPWVASAPGFEDLAGETRFQAGKNVVHELKLEPSAGVLEVRSTPPGATVSVDGREVGLTPVKLRDVPAGLHSVQVSLEGHAAVFRSVDTTAGTRGAVDARLAKGGASITVSGGGSESEVRLNDVVVGKGATVRIPAVERGKVRVTVVEGEHVAEGTFSVPSRGALSLRAAGTRVVERKPLTQRWGFWAAIGGGMAVVTGTAVAVSSANQPPPEPTGDTVVGLP
jgi:hypothetical protein